MDKLNRLNLDLMGSQIGDIGARDLTRSIMEMNALTDLDLDFFMNDIGFPMRRSLRRNLRDRFFNIPRFSTSW